MAIEPNDFLDKINSLKSKKSVDYDNISTNFLKNIPKSANRLITILVSLSNVTISHNVWDSYFKSHTNLQI